jgi:hypothetical protein
MGLGKSAFESKFKFTQQLIQVEKNDMVYMGSDGYADQFGGGKGKKMIRNGFPSLCEKVAEKDT